MPTSAKKADSLPAGAQPTEAPRYLPLETISIRLHAPPHTDRRPVFGVVSNVSETGCCIITNRAVPSNIPVEMEIQTRREPKVLTLSAQVVWCTLRLEPVKEIVGYLTGVCFEDEVRGDVSRLLKSGIFQLIP